jgi:hypothetical protein
VGGEAETPFTVTLARLSPLGTLTLPLMCCGVDVV